MHKISKFKIRSSYRGCRLTSDISQQSKIRTRKQFNRGMHYIPLRPDAPRSADVSPQAIVRQPAGEASPTPALHRLSESRHKAAPTGRLQCPGACSGDLYGKPAPADKKARHPAGFGWWRKNSAGSGGYTAFGNSTSVHSMQCGWRRFSLCSVERRRSMRSILSTRKSTAL